MLPTELLSHRYSGETVVPKRLPLDAKHLAIAHEAIASFAAHQGKSQGDLDRHLQDWEGDSPDYRLRRGLAHLLRNHSATFEVVSPLEPPLLRDRVFTAAAAGLPLPTTRAETLAQVARELSAELGREILPAEVERGLYADLNENRILTEFDPPEPETLIHRYNLAQVQGLFYRASQATLHAYRNVPGEYKLLFRYLKLFQVMFYIEGDADCGFTITLDGPMSLFKTSTRYGLAFAKLLPALLHVTRWNLTATLHSRDAYSSQERSGRFSLDDTCGLVSHYPPGKPYDSLIEESFATQWTKAKTDWQLEREVDLIPIPGSVMIPDFRLVHPDGRTALLEIVGYWRPEYLRRKFSQVRRAQEHNLILAISERLNLEKAGVTLTDIPASIVWFKNKLQPAAVLAALEPP